MNLSIFHIFIENFYLWDDLPIFDCLFFFFLLFRNFWKLGCALRIEQRHVTKSHVANCCLLLPVLLWAGPLSKGKKWTGLVWAARWRQGDCFTRAGLLENVRFSGPERCHVWKWRWSNLRACSKGSSCGQIDPHEDRPQALGSSKWQEQQATQKATYCSQRRS